MTDDEKEKCEICGKEFDSKKALKTHITKSHDKEEIKKSDIEEVLGVLEDSIDEALTIKKEKEKLEDRIKEMQNEENELEHEVDDLEESKGKLKEKMKEIKNERDDLENEIETLKDDRAKLQAKKDSLENDIDSLEEEEENIEEELSKKKDVVRRLKHQIFEFDKKIKE